MTTITDLHQQKNHKAYNILQPWCIYEYYISVHSK